jgi:hypothetical protein
LTNKFASQWILSLDGEDWNFLLVDGYDDAPEGFHTTAFRPTAEQQSSNANANATSTQPPSSSSPSAKTITKPLSPSKTMNVMTPRVSTTRRRHSGGGGGNTGRKWAVVSIPGNWQVQGFGHPQYTNIRYPVWGPPCPPRQVCFNLLLQSGLIDKIAT